MKKIFLSLIIFLFSLFIFLLIILSTIGLETEKFNNIITNNINKTNKNFVVELNKIKFKFDIKEINLFLLTTDSIIKFKEIDIPAKRIKVYLNFTTLFGSEKIVEKVSLSFEDINVEKLKEISFLIPPSNFKNFINNNIIHGELNSEIEFYLDGKNSLDNFIAKGSVKNFKTKIIDEVNFENAKFSFFADRTDILIKNIFGNVDKVRISDGDLKIKFSPSLKIESNFLSNLKIDNTSYKKYSKFFQKQNLGKLINLNANFNNNISLNFDNTYKLENFNIKSGGKIEDAHFLLHKPLTNNILKKKIRELFFKSSEFNLEYNSKKNNLKILGEYSLDKKDFLTYELNLKKNGEILENILTVKFDKQINLEFINYQKPENTINNLYLNFEKIKDSILIKELEYTEGKNFLKAKDLKFNNNLISSFKEIRVKTYNNGLKNNDFSIFSNKKIFIKGSSFDASNLLKSLGSKLNRGSLKNLNTNIDVDFQNILAPRSEIIRNFKLIGEIKKGKFVKISSKGEFSDNKFLDISLKNDEKNKNKYLEIFSDLPKPLLSEYDFFKELIGGKLLYTSSIGENNSNSKLKIENFKLKNAPGLVKLLSLADLGGLADLAEGEGISFDELEINIFSENDFLKFNEIYAVGPSISVLMEGYKEANGLLSLRGTLVPAKNLNKIISKIPVIGEIVIPKEVGEGLFGISFKIKGKPGDIKTTINPIRTLTPRFIQKIIDKNKTK